MNLLLAVLLTFAPVANADDPPRRDRGLPPNVGDVALTLPDEGSFVFGPGDRFHVMVFRHPELETDIVVAPDGTITYPLVGRVQVAGRSYTEVVAALESGLREFYTDASVSVNVVTVTNQKVFVVGEVLNPTVLQITGEMTVLEALTRTGGINQNARTDNLLLIRGGLEEPELYTVDVGRLLSGDLSQNVQLQQLDIIVVPTRTIVNVERFFRHVQGILSPFVGGTQIYRNLNLGAAGPVIEDQGAN